MAENENKALDEEAIANCAYAAGYDLAHAIAVMLNEFARGVSNGLADGFAGLAAEGGGVELVNNGEDEEPELKTDIRDCRACWCDTCAKLEDCEKHRDGAEADGLRPFPCIGCLNGMRFKPQEEEPCDDYIKCDGNNNG